jgi:hypothetical protein
MSLIIFTLEVADDDAGFDQAGPVIAVKALPS